MLYATILHAIAGIVTGSFFKIRTLAFLLSVVTAEAGTLMAIGVKTGILWAAINLLLVQLGYCAGILTRAAIEQSGHSVPPARMRW